MEQGPDLLILWRDGRDVADKSTISHGKDASGEATSRPIHRLLPGASRS